MTDGGRVCRAILDNIGKVLVGKEQAAELALITLLCEGHLLVEDVPGVGKTALASSMARSLDCTFSRVQFTPDVLPSDITGFSLYNQKKGEFEFREGLVMSSFVLADEINRTSPKTQSSLLEAMEEGQVTVDGVTRSLGRPFMVMATQNPHEYVGTYPLPEAQMDRFMMRISLGYPEHHEEMNILRRFKTDDPMAELRPVATAEHIIALQEMVKAVYLEDSLYHYITTIVRGTRQHPSAELGASPRGSLALFRAAQAWALYQGREFTIPDDIKRMAVPVLSHRISLLQEARLRKVTQRQVVEEIVAATKIPHAGGRG